MPRPETGARRSYEIKGDANRMAPAGAHGSRSRVRSRSSRAMSRRAGLILLTSVLAAAPCPAQATRGARPRERAGARRAAPRRAHGRGAHDQAILIRGRPHQGDRRRRCRRRTLRGGARDRPAQRHRAAGVDRLPHSHHVRSGDYYKQLFRMTRSMKPSEHTSTPSGRSTRGSPRCGTSGPASHRRGAAQRDHEARSGAAHAGLDMPLSATGGHGDVNGMSPTSGSRGSPVSPTEWTRFRGKSDSNVKYGAISSSARERRRPVRGRIGRRPAVLPEELTRLVDGSGRCGPQGGRARPRGGSDQARGAAGVASVETAV